MEDAANTPVQKPVEHSTLEQAYETIQAAIIKAAKTGRFMVAVWGHEQTDSGSKTSLIRTTHQFPVGEYSTAIDMLKSDASKDAARISESMRPGPLELAELVNHARREAQAAQAVQQADETQLVGPQLIPADDSHAH